MDGHHQIYYLPASWLIIMKNYDKNLIRHTKQEKGNKTE